MAQIDSLVVGGLQLQMDTFKAAPSEFKFLPCCQYCGAIRGFNQGGRTSLHMRRNQYDIAAAGQNSPVNAQPSGGTHSPCTAKAQAPCHRIGLRHAQGAGRETSGIDYSPSAYCNAGRIDQNQPAVGTEIAENRAGVVAQHTVDARAGGTGLQKLGSGTRGHTETLPVQCAVRAACTVLGRDGREIALRTDGGSPVNGLHACGLRPHPWAGKTRGQ